MFHRSRHPWPFPNGENKRAIPKDLLPKFAHYTENNKWAQETYQYFHLFDENVKSTTFKDDNDLQKWKNCAVSMIDDLKEIGFVEAKNEIVRVAKDQFHLRVGNDKQICKWTDVVNKFADADWYYSNVEAHACMLYFFQYGIFRNGYNNWLLQASYNWMQKNNIVYDDNDNQQQRTKTKKGFVLEILHTKASNSIQDRFLRITRAHLGQYILCRKRFKYDKNNEHVEVKEMTFMKFNAYVVTDYAHSYFANKNNPLDKISNCINHALKHGTTKAEIMRFIESHLNNYGENICLFFLIKYYKNCI